MAQYGGQYMGGHPYMTNPVHGGIDMTVEGLIFKYGISTKMTIPFDCITSMQAMSNEQISKDVTLTRLLTLGVYAFGAKKTTKTRTTFLTIYCQIAGNDTAVVFQTSDAHKICAQYNMLRDKDNPEADSRFMPVKERIKFPILGYRTKKWWKILIATIYYFAILLFIVVALVGVCSGPEEGGQGILVLGIFAFALALPLFIGYKFPPKAKK